MSIHRVNFASDDHETRAILSLLPAVPLEGTDLVPGLHKLQRQCRSVAVPPRFPRQGLEAEATKEHVFDYPSVFQLPVRYLEILDTHLSACMLGYTLQYVFSR